MKIKSVLLAVKDIKKSRKFYEELFDLEVIYDFGENLVFAGGLALQEKFHLLTGLSASEMKQKANNMEIYFEVEDFDSFIQKIENYQKINFLHPPLQHAWQQRVVRIYDPDFHLIEIGESMEVVVANYLKAGHSIEETVEVTQHPLAFVQMVREKFEL